MQCTQNHLFSITQWCVALLTLGLVLTLPLGHVAAQTSYTLTTFDLFPEAVNKAGTVCGQYQGLPGRIKSGWASPEVLPGAIYPGTCTAVNNFDHYTGNDQAPDGRGFWFLGSAATNRLTRPKVPSTTSFTHGGFVNDNRELIGYMAYTASNGTTQHGAARWTTPQSTPIILREADGQGPVVTALNKKGRAVGFMWAEGDGSSPSFPFVQNRGQTGVTNLAAGGIPWAQNNLNWLAGENDLTGQARIWFPSGNPLDLMPWCPEGAGPSGLMQLFGINQAVSAVGVTYCEAVPGEPWTPYAFRWDHWTNTFHNLNASASAPECHLQVATAMSEAGHVTGVGTCSGVAVGFLLTPVVSSVAVQ